MLYRNVQRFRGGLVFKAHGLLYHSTLGLRAIKKREEEVRGVDEVWLVREAVLRAVDREHTAPPLLGCLHVGRPATHAAVSPSHSLAHSLAHSLTHSRTNPVGEECTRWQRTCVGRRTRGASRMRTAPSAGEQPQRRGRRMCGRAVRSMLASRQRGRSSSRVSSSGRSGGWGPSTAALLGL